MKRNFFYVMLVSLLVIGMLAFVGCSDDDDDDGDDGVMLPNAAQNPIPNDGQTDVQYNNDGKIELGWEYVEEDGYGIADSFRVLMGDEVDGNGDIVDPFIQSIAHTPGVTDYYNTKQHGLPNGTTWYWQVIPFNEEGDAANTVVWSFTTAMAPFQATFKVIDGTEAYTNIKFKSNFDDWQLHPMNDDDGDHTWEVTIDLPDSAGSYEWGAIEDDGSEWGIWLIEGDNLTFDVSADGAVTGDLTYEIPAPGEAINITFQVDMSAETVSENGVHIAGSFQGWAPAATEMLDDDEDGIYEVTVELDAGAEIEYKFVNGNDWNPPGGTGETVPEECGIDDDYGGFNRPYTVPTVDATVGYVFGTCDEIGGE